MKTAMHYLPLIFLMFLGLSIKAQNIDENTEPPKLPTDWGNLSKGKSQLAIQGLSFGYGNGRVYGSLGLRYGIFVADKNMIFVDGDVSFSGKDDYLVTTSLNYRYYFSDWKVKPYAQLGAGMAWKHDYPNVWKTSYFIAPEAGASIQVGRFSFEAGIQLQIWDKVIILPTVGVSFTF